MKSLILPWLINDFTLELYYYLKKLDAENKKTGFFIIKFFFALKTNKTSTNWYPSWTHSQKF